MQEAQALLRDEGQLGGETDLRSALELAFFFSRTELLAGAAVGHGG